MNPEYISKTGYDARAGTELTRNSIQMTGLSKEKCVLNLL